MKASSIPIFFLVLLITALSFVPYVYADHRGKSGCVYYLTQVCFDSEISLCWDSPRYYRYNVWATPDNKIAYFALIDYNFDVAEKIKKQLQNITETYNLPHDYMGLPVTFKHDPLFNVELPDHDGFNKSVWITLYNQSGYTIKVDIANSTEKIEDWDAYADLCIYEALDLYLKGNVSQAKKWLDHVIRMWDGYGIKDREYFNNGGKYETYKLALLYYANSIINDEPLPFQDELVDRIWKQQASNGGIHTHYRANGDYAFSDTNVETTALVLYAKIPDPKPSSQAWYEDPKMFGIVMIMSFLGIIVVKTFYDMR